MCEGLPHDGTGRSWRFGGRGWRHTPPTSAQEAELVHQLAMSAQKRWRRLPRFGQLADVVAGVRFIDGMDERTIGRKAA